MMSPSELIELALAGVDGDEMAFATRLEFKVSATAATRFRRWRRNENAPDYEATLILLDAAGLLRTLEDLDELAKIREEVESLRDQIAESRRRAAR